MLIPSSNREWKLFKNDFNKVHMQTQPQPSGRLRAWRVPKFAKWASHMLCGFYSAFGAVYEAKLGHGRPLVFLRSRDVLAATVVMKTTNKHLSHVTKNHQK